MRLVSYKILIILLLVSCKAKVKQEPIENPWGDDSDASTELIMLTISGPDTYYEYHGQIGRASCRERV